MSSLRKALAVWISLVSAAPPACLVHRLRVGVADWPLSAVGGGLLRRGLTLLTCEADMSTENAASLETRQVCLLAIIRENSVICSIKMLDAFSPSLNNYICTQISNCYIQGWDFSRPKWRSLPLPASPSAFAVGGVIISPHLWPSLYVGSMS
ncbi:unnamed protein product [Rangifer tarandus platyrhynchus]|uniref:Uncharacterized protein n=1 Tax=Rangifer tarandus platyrhynchus TaxID=3082113 RepID=A0ABN8ZFC3_RANTA|nr:unnamed protein product [Rangifer tarandus platyrhynchus]